MTHCVTLLNASLRAARGLRRAARYYGWQVAALNSQSFSPALDVNLRWLYLSSVAGGALITIYSFAGLHNVWLGREPRAPETH